METAILQQGLIGILEHASAQSISEQERSDLQLRTQLFYFNRCVTYPLHDIALPGVNVISYSYLYFPFSCIYPVCKTFVSSYLLELDFFHV